MLNVWIVMLQFGHGCDAVETFTYFFSRKDLESFNSATVVTPWKQKYLKGAAENSDASIRPRL